MEINTMNLMEMWLPNNSYNTLKIDFVVLSTAGQTF